MFSKTLLALLLLFVVGALAQRKPNCPVCRDYYSSSSGSSPRSERNSCSRARRSRYNSPCYGSKVCKVFNANYSNTYGAGFFQSYTYISITQIGCFYPWENCLSEFGPSFKCSSYNYS